MNHTPEPWRAEWQPGQTPKHTYTHCVVCGDDALCDTLTMADANRIVACVNALAGIPDPAAFVARAKRIEEKARELLDCGLTCGGEYKCDDRWCDEAKALRTELEANP